jgi:hypothetical protein
MPRQKTAMKPPAAPDVLVATHAGSRLEGYAHRMVNGYPACPAETTGAWVLLRYAAAVQSPTIFFCPWSTCFSTTPGAARL